MRLPVFQWGASNMLLKHILKMTLTGKAQVAADLAQGFIGIAKQRLRFPQAAIGNRDAEGRGSL